MTYKGHTIGGVVAAVIAVNVTHGDIAAMVAVSTAALLGALAPDIDHPSSYLGRRLVPIAILWRALISNPLTWLIAGRKRMRRLAGHRGLSHSLLGLVLASGAFGGIWVWGEAWLAVNYPALLGVLTAGLSEQMAGGARLSATLTIGFALGYASHILLDMMTVSGVALLLPRSDRRFWVLPRPLRVTSS
jgi:inner membrane protein